MDKYLDARFERVEKALAVLIDSIAKYNPSEKLAEDLVQADQELQQGLKELERHQNNHARIQQLRNETASLDAQTKDTIGALWSMRKEVKITPTTVYPPGGPKYNFTTEELLDYARRISRNTLPPPGVTNGIDLNANAPSGGATPGPETAAPTPNASFNGGTGTVVNTPATTAAPPTPLPNGAPNIGGPAANPSIIFEQSQATIASTAATEMPDNLKPYVDRLHGAVFYPWPTEDNIRRGALGAYQQLVDSGIDPKGYDPEEEARRKEEEEQARKEADEAARLEREEAERRMREERERMARDREQARQEAERRGSVIGGPGEGGVAAHGGRPPQQKEKKQFAFLGGDDEDDDDDD